VTDLKKLILARQQEADPAAILDPWQIYNIGCYVL
jgi:hypothetical protein